MIPVYLFCQGDWFCCTIYFNVMYGITLKDHIFFKDIISSMVTIEWQWYNKMIYCEHPKHESNMEYYSIWWQRSLVRILQSMCTKECLFMDHIISLTVIIHLLLEMSCVQLVVFLLRIEVYICCFLSIFTSKLI